MRTATTLLIVTISSIWATAARAQTPVCVTGSPGSADCQTKAAQPPQVGLFAPAPDGPPPAPAASSEPEEPVTTHNFFLPNGNLTPTGRFDLSVHGLGVYNRIAYGINERFEVSAGIPVIPIVGTLGVRAQLAPPTSPWRMVVGLTAGLPVLLTLADNGPYRFWTQAMGTVGYYGDRFAAYGTLSGALHTGDGFQLPAANVGASMKLGRKVMAHVNYSSVNITGTDLCDPCTNPRVNNLMFGVKYMTMAWDADFGVMIAFDPDSPGDVIALPMLSVRRTY